ncbi:hypothetical protein [Nonomuraea sp. NPDC049129]|uniref:hypothetical protein n=1 Tax=Nonomuraea sp. NPDC049129 TaxID=3155272 RepID=UPI0034074D80
MTALLDLRPARPLVFDADTMTAAYGMLQLIVALTQAGCEHGGWAAQCAGHLPASSCLYTDVNDAEEADVVAVEGARCAKGSSPAGEPERRECHRNSPLPQHLRVATERQEA